MTRQAIRRYARSKEQRTRLLADPANHLSLHHICHYDHHAAARKLPVAVLPDSVFVFASALMGPGAAYEWLIRAYEGEDPRLDALLAAWEEAA